MNATWFLFFISWAWWGCEGRKEGTSKEIKKSERNFHTLINIFGKPPDICQYCVLFLSQFPSRWWGGSGNHNFNISHYMHHSCRALRWTSASARCRRRNSFEWEKIMSNWKLTKWNYGYTVDMLGSHFSRLLHRVVSHNARGERSAFAIHVFLRRKVEGQQEKLKGSGEKTMRKRKITSFTIAGSPSAIY